MLIYIATIDIKYDDKYSEVVGYKLSSLNNNNNFDGTDIYTFMDTISDIRSRARESMVVYIHDLSFCGISILDYLLHNGYEWASNSYEMGENKFTALLNNTNSIYSITVCVSEVSDRRKNITFVNSSNIFPLSIEDTKIQCKLNDYSDIDTLRYIINTVNSYGLLFTNNHRPIITTAQASMQHFINFIGGKGRYRAIFPELSEDVDNEIRKAYHGGYLYINDNYINKNCGHGYVIDNNGLYAYVMKNCVLPYGHPVKFEGDYKSEANAKLRRTHPLYIQKIKGSFMLKNNMLPTVTLEDEMIDGKKQLKFFTEGHNELFLTNVDLKMFCHNYHNDFDIMDIQKSYCGGYAFEAGNILSPWVDYWCNERVIAEQEGDLGKRKFCKTIINSLSGKFASGNAMYMYKKPILDNEDIVGFVEDERVLRDDRGRVQINEETGEAMTSKSQSAKLNYIPISAFITSYGRKKTIATAQAIMDYNGKYIYSDTDSIHFEGDSIPTDIVYKSNAKFKFLENINLGNDIGDWKLEYEFNGGRYVGMKSYYLYNKDSTKVACAGLPKLDWNQITLDNFKKGCRYISTQTCSVKGGASKIKRTFELRGEVRQNLETLSRKRSRG